MRLSSSLPPAGFTRAEPSPPARRRLLRSPWPSVAAFALVLAAGLLGVGYGTGRTAPVRTVTPDAATPSPSAKPLPPPAERPAPANTSSAALERERTPRRAHPAPKPPRRLSATPHRPRPPAKRKPRKPRKARKARTARPAAPSWIAAECRRRFPGDPFRRSACVAALKRSFGG